jgi:uncharacterized protein
MKIALTFRIITVMVTCILYAQATAIAQKKVLIFSAQGRTSRKSMSAVAGSIAAIGKQLGYEVNIVSDTGSVDWSHLERNQVFVQLAPESAFSSQQLKSLEQFVVHEHGWLKISTATEGQSAKSDWIRRSFGGVAETQSSKTVQAVVVVEDHEHPLTANLPQAFKLKAAWPAFDKNPRRDVRVLASVDESSYHANPAMGDHPIVWVNENLPRMVFLGIGADPEFYDEPNCRLLVRNALEWLGSPTEKAQ